MLVLSQEDRLVRSICLSWVTNIEILQDLSNARKFDMLKLVYKPAV